MNARGLALFDVDDFEVVRGRFWPGLWPESARPLLDEAWRAALAGETRTFRAFCPTATGVPKWWDTTVTPVYGEDRIIPTRVLARSRDVTEDLETRSFLDAIIDSVPDPLFAKDAKTRRFVLVNRAAEVAFGRSKEEIIGRTDYDLFPKAQADIFAQNDRRVLDAGGVSSVIEEAVTLDDGKVQWYRTKIFVVHDDEGARHIVCIAEDISEARAAAQDLQGAVERAEAANQAKSDFLTTMSHEIRTPLNGILGMAQAMRNDDLDSGQRDRLKVITRSGETLLGILNDILDLSKIEAGRLELDLADFDMEHLIRGAAAAFAPMAERKGVDFSFTVDPSAAGRFQGDVTRVRRLIFNLLSNAVKFTEEGAVSLEAVRRDGQVIVTVTDSGIGISAEQMPTLFDKFRQGDASHTRRFGGSAARAWGCRSAWA